MSRIGLGRHAALDDDAGDPLDGLVNLFDVGMILAVAFLIAGLGLTLNAKGDRLEARAGATTGTSAGKERTIPDPAGGPRASGHGTPVGQVYRLPDGRLVYVRQPRSPARP
ncbi:MAG TPA: DUF2149 domain-containing protein [Solirubrobacterales bacterium]|nr:DUF2149 domain-containing protein [Solirubrobacterales bacterium]